MPTFVSYDGAELAFREVGDGPPLLVVTGGPARDAAYLGDLGDLALATGRTLVVPDLRGTGDSQPDTAPITHRADRIAADVAALAERFGPVDLLAHSGGGNVALLLAERRPDLVSRLVLVTPGTRSVGLQAGEADWEAAVERRSQEPWYAGARAALEADDPTPEQDLESSAFFYGRWDEAARAHAASDPAQRNVAATGWFDADAYHPERTRAALRRLTVPARIPIGASDIWPNVDGAGRLAALFDDATVTVLPGAGHFPWLDDPVRYAAAVRHSLTT